MLTNQKPKKNRRNKNVDLENGSQRKTNKKENENEDLANGTQRGKKEQTDRHPILLDWTVGPKLLRHGPRLGDEPCPHQLAHHVGEVRRDGVHPELS